MYVATNIFSSLLLLAGITAAVTHFELTFNDKTLPRTLVDTLLQSSICVCRKLSINDYFASLKLNCKAVNLPYNRAVGRNIVVQQVFGCSQKCLM